MTFLRIVSPLYVIGGARSFPKTGLQFSGSCAHKSNELCLGSIKAISCVDLATLCTARGKAAADLARRHPREGSNLAALGKPV
jgi:hypothetical protein